MDTLEIFLLEKQRHLQLEPSVDECLSSKGRVLFALYVIGFGVILHRALDVARIRVCFLNASLVAPLPLIRGCPPQQPGSFILNTLGSRRGAASNEIRGRCIEGRRHAQFSFTFPCCAPFVFAQNGAAALQHPGGRLPATFPGGNAHGWRERSQCVCDWLLLLLFFLFFWVGKDVCRNWESLRLRITFCGPADARKEAGFMIKQELLWF